MKRRLQLTAIYTVLLVLIDSGFSFSWGQEMGDSALILLSAPFEQSIEDAVISSGDEIADWTAITDVLEQFRRYPVDLNTATNNELALLPGIEPKHIQALHTYIREHGALTNVFELQAVTGFSNELFQRIRPFITVRNAGKYDISDPNTHTPAGPSLSEIIKRGSVEYIQRIGRILEPQKGYQINENTQLPNYAGSPWRIYSRLRYTYRNNISVGIIGEKDAGESFDKGYDYLSAHVYLRDFKKLKRLIIGDYVLQLGQGLLMSKGIGFGKGADIVQTLNPPDLGIIPHTSVNENNFLRGSAASWQLTRSWLVTAFFSNNKLDATVNTDSLLETPDAVTNIRAGGYHRTISEKQGRKQLKETITGMRIAYQPHNRLQIGLTGYRQQFDRPIAADSLDPYRLYDFRGKIHALFSTDWDLTWRNLNFFGELATSRNGANAIIAGAVIALHPKIDMAIQYRNFDNHFYSSYGYSFAESPYRPAGESGTYLGIAVRPATGWVITAFFDQYKNRWYRYLVTDPMYGNEFLAQLTFTPSKQGYLSLRLRNETKSRDAVLSDRLPAIERLVGYTRQGLRLEGSWQPDIIGTIKLKSRIEYSRFLRQQAPTSRGVLLYQDIIIRMNRQFRCSGRYAIFETTDYDSRIYAYENDMPTIFSIPAFFGRKGIRYYWMLNYEPVPGLDVWVRLAGTRLLAARTIGSGNELIEGSRRTEVRFQIRYIFGGKDQF